MPTAGPHTANMSFISDRFYAKLVVLFMEIAKFTGSWPPLPNSSKVEAQKVAKESEKRGGIKRKKSKKPQTQTNMLGMLGPLETVLFVVLESLPKIDSPGGVGSLYFL